MEQANNFRDFLVQSASELRLIIDEEMVERFKLYLDQMVQWNRVSNLTSITDTFEILSKHFVDSLTVLAATKVPPHTVLIDIGSGAGFPGIPLKIVRGDIRLVLVEPTKKKSSFLASVVGSLKLRDVSIFTGTIQEYITQENYLKGDLIAVRALRFDEVEKFAAKALTIKGKVALYRTQKIEASSIPSAFTVEAEKLFSLPMDHGARVITILSRCSSSAN